MDRGELDVVISRYRHISVAVNAVQQNFFLDLLNPGHVIWTQVPIRGWLQAFEAHPRIGDTKTLRTKRGAFGELSRDEQAAASSANQAILQVSHTGTLGDRL